MALVFLQEVNSEIIDFERSVRTVLEKGQTPLRSFHKYQRLVLRFDRNFQMDAPFVEHNETLGSDVLFHPVFKQKIRNNIEVDERTHDNNLYRLALQLKQEGRIYEYTSLLKKLSKSVHRDVVGAKLRHIALIELAKENGLVLLEDSAQSLGSFYPDGRHIGRAGMIGSFSFSAPKIISTGQGGALITDCDITARSLRRLKDFGRSGGGNDIHDTIGFNFKFTELQACIGIEQMKKLDDRVKRKKQMYTLYKNLLCNIDGIKLFENVNETTAPWFIDCIASDRDSLLNHLKGCNIGTRVMYPPINKQKAYDMSEVHAVSEHVGTNGLWLPSAVQLSDDEIHYICQAISSFYEA